MPCASEPDLFNAQADLFGAPPPQSYAPPIETVRAEVHRVLGEAKSATVMPWPAKKASYWKTVFPQMTNWLPPEEAAQLRFAFMEEMKRLEAA
jgi:hypothetical protein